MFDPVIEPENLLLFFKKKLLGITLKLTKVIYRGLLSLLYVYIDF